jgi:hypothetical protein
MTSSSFSILALTESRSESMVLTSSTGSPRWGGLKPRDTSATSVWSGYLKLSFRRLLLPFHQPLLPVHQIFLPGVPVHVPNVGQAKTLTRVSSRSFRSTARVVSRLLRSDSRDARALCSCAHGCPAPPLLWLQLLVCHYLLPLSHGRHLCVEVLLLLDGGIGTSLTCGVLLLGVMQ